MTFREAAARTVKIRAEELWEQSTDVLDMSDIERVHAMRVASRRLRAVLEVYAPCFPKAEHRAALRDVKLLADALGARRDPDVQLEDVDELLAALPEADAAGLGVLRERIRGEQIAGNATLAAALQTAAGHDLRGRLEALVAGIEDPA